MWEEIRFKKKITFLLYEWIGENMMDNEDGRWM